MKFLLIDDEAEKGWDTVLSAILKEQFGQEAALDCVSKSDSITDDITKDKYHLIFLDLRFGEKDHFEDNFRKLTGYQVLEQLRNPTNKNFASPVIIFSASSKIWIVEDLLQEGADSYYIKESPLFVHDETFTKNNHLRFLNELSRLNELAIRRFTVWQKICVIKEKSAAKILNPIIQQRVIEKLHIGYGTLFRHLTAFEKKNFFYTNEVMAFIVFWSILEEISKDFYVVDWNKNPDNYSWKVRGTRKFFIEDNIIRTHYVISGTIKIVLISRDKQNIELKERKPESNESYSYFMRKNAREISLSDQIVGLLHLKFGWDYTKVTTDFLGKLNTYRNNIDFIHGNAIQTTSKTVLETFNDNESFTKCNEILDFLDNLLS